MTRYDARDFHGPGAPGDTLHIPGSRVLWCAPHAVRQIRDGQPKASDRLTGPLAELLARSTGGGCLTLTGSAGDANWDARHPFKTRLAEIAPGYELIIDLHGMRDSHGMHVCVGRGAGPGAAEDAITRRILHLAATAGLAATVDDPFDATRPATVTSFAQQLGCVAVQVELARALRADLPALVRAAAWLGALISPAGLPGRCRQGVQLPARG